MAALGFVGGEGMSDLITMDDLTNDEIVEILDAADRLLPCLLYTSPSPRDQRGSRMPSSA